MKVTQALAAVSLLVVMVTATPSKRFLKHGLHHLGHEIKHGLDHIGHEIDHGVHHLGHELSHITGVHNPRDLACKLYPVLKSVGLGQCTAHCNAAAASSAGAFMPLCPAACNMVVHQASKLAGC